MELIWVGIGGAVGSIGRYLVGRNVTERTAGVFPYGTFTVNLIGALLIGVLFALLTERAIGSDQTRNLLIVGLLGGFTTFSSLALETVNLLESGHWASAIVYVVGTNVLGIACCLAGIGAVRWAL